MHPSPLNQIKIASPCNMEWHWMSGDDRVRYCRQCNLNVYNLSGLNRWEAEELILRAEGRLCVRFYRRPDGTVLTEDCPVGLRAVKKRLSRLRQHLIGATMSFLGLFSFFGGYKSLAMEQEVTGKMVVTELPIQGLMTTRALAPPHSFIPVERSESFIREKARFKVTPIYHTNGLQQVTGKAIVKVMISADGRVETADLLSGNSLFKTLAEEAASRWKFEPTIIDGEPVRVESKLTFYFK